MTGRNAAFANVREGQLWAVCCVAANVWNEPIVTASKAVIFGGTSQWDTHMKTVRET